MQTIKNMRKKGTWTLDFPGHGALEDWDEDVGFAYVKITEAFMLANYFYFHSHFYAHSWRLPYKLPGNIAMSRPGIGGMGIIDVVYGAIYDDSTFLFPPHCKESWGIKKKERNRKEEGAAST